MHATSCSSGEWLAKDLIHASWILPPLFKWRHEMSLSSKIPGQSRVIRLLLSLPLYTFLFSHSSSWLSRRSCYTLCVQGCWYYSRLGTSIGLAMPFVSASTLFDCFHCSLLAAVVLTSRRRCFFVTFTGGQRNLAVIRPSPVRDVTMGSAHQGFLPDPTP